MIVCWESTYRKLPIGLKGDWENRIKENATNEWKCAMTTTSQYGAVKTDDTLTRQKCSRTIFVTSFDSFPELTDKITGDVNVDRLRRVSPLRATYALIILTATRQLNSMSRPMPDLSYSVANVKNSLAKKMHFDSDSGDIYLDGSVWILDWL